MAIWPHVTSRTGYGEAGPAAGPFSANAKDWPIGPSPSALSGTVHDKDRVLTPNRSLLWYYAYGKPTERIEANIRPPLAIVFCTAKPSDDPLASQDGLTERTIKPRISSFDALRRSPRFRGRP